MTRLPSLRRIGPSATLLLALGLVMLGCSLLPTPNGGSGTTTSTATSTSTSTSTTTTTTTTIPSRSIRAAVCDQRTTSTASTPLPAWLNEISGIAASRAHPDTIWAIEDSGNPASVSALKLDGTVAGTISLTATNIDWEALAIRPGPRGDQLVIGDIGDNSVARSTITFYLLDEPAPRTATATPERIDAMYVDGPHNAEAIVATADDIFVLTKVSGRSSVYRLEGSRLVPAGSLVDDPGLITDAAASFDGTMTTLRTYGSIRVNDVANADVSSALTSRGCTMPFVEPQGEAITFLPDGSGLVTVSEISPAVINVSRPRN